MQGIPHHDGRLIHRGQGFKPGPVYLPGHGIVLADAAGGRAHHGIGFVVIHQQADNTGLGNKGMNFILDPQIAFTLGSFPVHAGTVIAHDALNPVLNPFGRIRRGIDRQVSALAVPHQPQRCFG